MSITRTLPLLVLTLLLPTAPAHARQGYAVMRGELGRDGTFTFHAEKGGGKQHWVRGRNGVRRHPRAGDMGRVKIDSSSPIVVRMPDGKTRILSAKDLRQKQRSYASAHASNQANKARRVRPPSGFRACRAALGKTVITGKKLAQSWDRLPQKVSIKQIQLDIPANAVKLDALDAAMGSRRKLDLGGAKAKYRSLYNGRPIS